MNGNPKKQSVAGPFIQKTVIIAFLLSSAGIFDAKILRFKTGYVFRFDGFTLGDMFTDIIGRRPYTIPCGIRPVDNSQRRVVFYAARSCQNGRFPNGTSAVFFIPCQKAAPMSQPVRAFAYLGGDYFTDKTNFPLRPGDSLKRMRAFLGKATRRFQIRHESWILNVRGFKNNVYVLCSGEKVVGFAFGVMPRSPANEQWGVILRIWARYTPKRAP